MYGQIALTGVVIGKVVLDHLTLVSQRQYEVVEIMALVDFQNVPENGMPIDFHHGLQFNWGFS